jgi:DNA-binding NarL/FixJ family response regulator
MLTSSKEQKDVIESYNLGVNSYLVKPVSFASFTETVQQIGMYWLVGNPPSGIKTVTTIRASIAPEDVFK